MRRLSGAGMTGLVVERVSCWHPRRSFSGRRRGGAANRCEVMVAGGDACSAQRRDLAEPLARDGERGGPGPVAIDLEVGASPVTHELGGDMQQPLAKAFGSAVIPAPADAARLH